ncbi:serine/threonine protein kinase [Saprolegnia diclina VS20]|uniref:Serine/threonine protein kinase n=1 Tax=Saprolegnia diclina (strain VS20) TaxID=1156394 RepID=T0S0B3_SAPDV|nr:serine/threonine protein kinase [Saprolegnia diclina VS20]EQC36042.1 serine/threonine protein kinase [Saprolegnia diclina VS20]|eukprot:XP_008610804.1 serine/threonine protein kinase [Saprolegnia diclina VS20]
MDEAVHFPIGTNMDSYVVQKRLSMAVYGDVVLACAAANNPVAIKRLDVNATLGHVSFQRARVPTTKDFERELEVYEYLGRAGGHGNIVQFIETFEHFGYYHLVLEHCADGSLVDKTLSAQQLLLLFTQLLDAISFLHAHGIAHGDIAPSNVLCHGQATYKLCDFGSAIVLANCTSDEAAAHRLRDLQALGSLVAAYLQGAAFTNGLESRRKRRGSAPAPLVLSQLLEFIRVAPQLSAMELLVQWQRSCSSVHESSVCRPLKTRRVFIDAL